MINIVITIFEILSSIYQKMNSINTGVQLAQFAEKEKESGLLQ